jgi:hypothetical protein
MEVMKTLSGALRLALFAPDEHERTAAFEALRRVVASNRLGAGDVSVVAGASMAALAAAIAERGGDAGDADKLAGALAGLVAGGEELYTKTQLLELAGQYQALIDQQAAASEASAAMAEAAGTFGAPDNIPDALGKSAFILTRLAYLNAWEREFAQSVHSQLQDPFRSLSAKQIPIFKKIYRKCGGII